MPEEKYVVGIPTPFGIATISSQAQWRQAEFVGAYIAVSRRNQDRATGKVKVSAFFTNTEEDARRRIHRSTNAVPI